MYEDTDAYVSIGAILLKGGKMSSGYKKFIYRIGLFCFACGIANLWLAMYGPSEHTNQMIAGVMGIVLIVFAVCFVYFELK